MATFLAGFAHGHIFKELHSFGIPELSGANPDGLVQASDGMLYGTTDNSQTVHRIFRLNLTNNQKTVLFVFDPALQSPRCLLEGPGGALYGIVSHYEDLKHAGSVFRIERDGSGFALIATFSGVSNYEPVTLVTDGQGLYGMTRGTYDGRGAGTVFRVNPDGTGMATLRVFPSGLPVRLVASEGNALYGATFSGGSNNRGTVFRMNTDGSDYRVIYNCDATTANPALLTQGPDGALYGMTFLTGVLFKLNADGSGAMILRRFGTRVVGSSLFVGDNGVLYGATSNSGANNSGQVFTIQPDGTGFMSLYDFPTSGNSAWPLVLIEGADHALYGCAQQGGIDPTSGVIFKLNTDGTGYAHLNEFQLAGGDGANPSSLVPAKDGRIYGITRRGGAHGRGSIFRQNRDGTGYSLIHDFAVGEGIAPNDLAEGEDGALYGTTSDEGGTVFKISRDGTAFKELHRFGAAGDGAAPMGLIMGKGGVMYGTTTAGGAHDRGIVFRINCDGSDYAVLHNPDYRILRMPLLGVDGALYGVQGDDTAAPRYLYQITPAGVFSVVQSTLVPPSLRQGIGEVLYGYGIFLVTKGTEEYATGSYYKLDLSSGQPQIRLLGEDWRQNLALRDDSAGYRGSEILLTTDNASKEGDASVPLVDLKDLGYPCGMNEFALGRDGVYYGSTAGCGDVGFGMVFSFELSPRLSLGDRRRELNYLMTQATEAKDRQRLTKALESLDTALSAECWLDDDRLVARASSRVFHELKESVHHVEAVSRDSRSPMSKDAVEVLIERIQQAAKTLSQLQNP